MNSIEVKECLLNNNVLHLFHANTVLTSLTYLRYGGLLSRETVENIKLPQTPQETDESDKNLEIFNDIFFDSVDIHKRISTLNDYGPVLFVYSVDVLDSLNNYEICVTRDNPIRWDTQILEKDRYFLSKQELENGFIVGDFRQHITIRNISEKLSFDYLEQIIIDNPGTLRQKYLKTALNKIEDALSREHIDIPVVVRNCSDKCRCIEKYTNYKEGYTYHRFKTNL